MWVTIHISAVLSCSLQIKCSYCIIAGHIQLYETYNVGGERVDILNFHTIAIRNYGTLTADSGFIKRTLHGHKLQVTNYCFLYFLECNVYLQYDS